MKPLRLLLADDHAVLRTGLAALLNAREDMEVVGEAANGSEVLSLAEVLQPDVVLLDLSMPLLSGLDVVPLLRQRAPTARILILTMHDDGAYLRQALKAGASGYMLKRAADVELIAAIQVVMRGDIYVHPSMTRSLLDDKIPIAPEASGNEVDLWATLSEREQEVLRLVALGHTSREIAERLDLSDKTVDTYRLRGMEKLNLRSRAALVRYALSRGLLE
jgi:two-component system, NarL family, response regulator NreC